jgi:hypothetical protein
MTTKMKALLILALVMVPTHIQSFTPLPKAQKVAGTCTTTCSPDGHGGSRCVTSCCQHCF